MNSINKYLKIARDAVIKPSDDIERKIIDRISHINKSDENLLDDRFLDFFRKSNSRIYLIIKKIKNNPGAFTTLAITIIFIIIFILFIVKVFPDEETPADDSYRLSSSKNDAQKD